MAIYSSPAAPTLYAGSLAPLEANKSAKQHRFADALYECETLVNAPLNRGMPSGTPSCAPLGNDCCCFCYCGSGRSRGDCDAKAAVVITVATVVLADVVAVGCAIAATADAAKEAGIAEDKRDARFAASRELSESVATLKPEAQAQIKRDIQTVGSSLQTIGVEEVTVRKARIITTGAASAAAAGLFNAVLCAIAVACLKTSAAVMAHATGVACIAGLSACFCPPLLIALAAILVVGLVVHMALNYHLDEVKRKTTQDANQAITNIKRHAEDVGMDH